MLTEGEENLSLGSRSVVSSAAADCRTSNQLGPPVKVSVPSRAQARSPSPPRGLLIRNATMIAPGPLVHCQQATFNKLSEQGNGRPSMLWSVTLSPIGAVDHSVSGVGLAP
jgi:hypothetical protein